MMSRAAQTHLAGREFETPDQEEELHLFQIQIFFRS